MIKLITKSIIPADPTPHRCTFRVYYGDTDAGGVMYHAAYIDFFARARNEWARTIGFGISEQNQRGICLVVHEISATYHKPAKLDDLVEIETTLITASRIKILFHQKLYRTDPQSHLKSLLAEAQVSVVCVDQKSLQVKRLSQEDLALLHST